MLCVPYERVCRYANRAPNNVFAGALRAHRSNIRCSAPYSQGSFDNLELIRSAGVECPLLCKEFIVDPYQIYLARKYGADAILLIAAVLPNQVGAFSLQCTCMHEGSASPFNHRVPVHMTIRDKRSVLAHVQTWCPLSVAVQWHTSIRDDHYQS